MSLKSIKKHILALKYLSPYYNKPPACHDNYQEMVAPIWDLFIEFEDDIFFRELEEANASYRARYGGPEYADGHNELDNKMVVIKKIFKEAAREMKLLPKCCNLPK